MKKKAFGHVRIPFKRIHIELTNICEFNCVFCPKPFMSRRYGYMDTELAKATVSAVGRHGLAEKITFHVMGEPTLHPDFFDILEHAAAEGVPVGLTTNGAGLSGEIGRRLLDYPLHQIDVSLQTPDEKSFALRRAGKLGYQDYIDGVFNFFVAYRARHEDAIFKLRFLNTTIPLKSLEKKMGPVRVISSKGELRDVFSTWTERVYKALDLPPQALDEALARIARLGSLKWNVVEVLPNVFFETYLLADWGNAFYDGKIRPAWAGYCFGMRDHFAVLHSGDVVLCCIDFDGRTAVGNLHQSSLAEVLSSDRLGEIMKGFRRFKPVHPYCKICLGGKNLVSWLTKPAATLIGLYALKPYFYRRVRLYE